MDIDNIQKSLYDLQRFQILQTKLNPQTADSMPNHYAYAWYRSVYPIMDDYDGFHDGHEKFFRTTKEQVDEISKRADSEWLEGRLYTFYEYEDHYNCRSSNPTMNISRGTLIGAFRYFYLHGGFDEKFWKKLLEPMNYPSEAGSIASDFNTDRIYFI